MIDLALRPRYQCLNKANATDAPWIDHRPFLSAIAITTNVAPNTTGNTHRPRQPLCPVVVINHSLAVA